MKTNKSWTKRIKQTKSGKTIARKSGFNHFNAKQSRTTQLQAKKGVHLSLGQKLKARFLPGHSHK